MKKLLILIFNLFVFTTFAISGDKYEFSWSSQADNSDPVKTLNVNAAGALPDSINQIKNVRAGIDLDKDGKHEFMVPVWHIEDGVNRRSVFVFENTGNDSYEMVWSYQFPGIADQFVTVDVSDLDGDGNQEILAVNVRAEGDDDSGPNLFVFEYTGTDNDYGVAPAVTWDLGSAGRDVVRVAKAADLDGDGKQEVVMTSFLTQPAIVVASVSDFALPVWTIEHVNNDIGGNAPDIAAIGIGDMDGDGTPEVVMSEGATEQVVVLEASAADTYDEYFAAVPMAGKTVSVHGIDLADANGDGQDEAFFANLQGAVWVIATDDVSTIDSTNIHLIDDTEEQWLETGIGDFSGRGLDFVIAASNASKAIDYQYTGGPGGDVTDPGNYAPVTIVDVDDFASVVPGGLRVYGLDIGSDMDGDGLQEVVFSRGSTRGGADAQAIFILELVPEFAMASALPDSINQIKNVRAGIDLDKDGKHEFMVPVWHIEDGVNRRSVFVYENTGNDSYEMVWSYQFPGIADQFVTVDVSDLDGDGNQEILAVNVRAEGDDDSGPNLFVFEYTGTDNDYGVAPAVTWDLGSAGRDVVRVAKAADLDGDGKQEVVMTSFLTQPAIVVASVSDFALPVWTIEHVNNDIGGNAPDIAAIGIGDMDGDGTPEVVMSEGATEQVVVLEASAADTYDDYFAAVPMSGKTVSVHGIDLADANGDGQDEAFFANLQGAVWVIASDDVSTIDSTDIHLIDDTEEQWLETGIGDFSGRGLDFVIAASNASKAVDYQYTGGPGGDVTDPGNYAPVTVVDVDDFASMVPGGLRVYGLDVADDMDGDGLQEIVFSRGSTRGGADAPAIFILELAPLFTNAIADALPDSINQIKNVSAGTDLDKDGKQEFMVPVWHIEDGVNRRSVFVFENTGNDSYEMVWSYQFPGIADQFVTVDVSDLDGDGNLEILAVNVRAEGDDDSGPNLFVFEYTGTDNDYGVAPAVTWDLGSAGRDVVRVAKAADLDGDGKQEVVMTSFLTQPAIVVASVSDFALPVWTIEHVNNDIGGNAPDIAAIGIGDMDGDGTPEVVMSEGATEQVVVLEASAADTYDEYFAAVPMAGKTVSVHGIDLADANGDGQDEAFFANLQGAVWVIASDDVSTIDSTNIHLIDDTEEQWLETGIGDFSGRGLDFVIAASNASKAVDYQYTGGPGGDVTDPGNYAPVTVVDMDFFASSVPGGIRVYGLDIGSDMDGDGVQEIVFSRGSTRGGADAPSIFILELDQTLMDQLFEMATALEDLNNLPKTLALDQNYPNPFNPTTNIRYSLNKPTHVKLTVYDALGRKVATLVNGYQTNQAYTVSWNAKNQNGTSVSSGLYFYKLDTEFGSIIRKMNLIR